jgi:hypothetical protein
MTYFKNVKTKLILIHNEKAGQCSDLLAAMLFFIITTTVKDKILAWYGMYF